MSNLPAQRMSRTQRTTLLGLAVNVLLAFGKLVAGLVGHSYALVADAVESLGDLVGSVVILGGLHIGARPADTNHPYGHGKAEALAALVVAVLIFIAGIGIGVKAVDEILTPHHAPEPWTLIVLIVVIIAKTVLSRYTAHVARSEGSGAVQVDAGHHLSDAITSAAAFIGISIAVFGQRLFGVGHAWASADDYAALFAALIIMYNGARLARIPLRELMDEMPADVLVHARRVAASIPGVRGIEKARARTSGGRHYLELHAEVDPHMTVADAHIITGKIKAAIKHERPTVADVLVHVEPHAASTAAAPSASHPTVTSSGPTAP
jgi:cation diffusion facilitator family transporter